MNGRTEEAKEAASVGIPFQPSLQFPYRWQDWAAPDGAKRIELQSGALGGTFAFVNQSLLPNLHGLSGARGCHSPPAGHRADYAVRRVGSG